MGMTNSITTATLSLSEAFDVWMDDKDNEVIISSLQNSVDRLDLLIRHEMEFDENPSPEARIAYNLINLVNKIAEDFIG